MDESDVVDVDDDDDDDDDEEEDGLCLNRGRK